MAETAGPVTLALGVPQRIELSATAGTLKRFDPPANARALRIVADNGALKIVPGGTDAAAIGSTAYDPAPARAATPYPIPGTRGGVARNIDSADAASNTRRVCIAGPASATFTITAVANLDDESITANVGGLWVAGGTIADLTAAYQVCALTVGTGLDLVPDSYALSLLEISMLLGDATSTTFTVKLTHDAAGDLLLLGPTTVGVEPGQTTATTKNASLDLSMITHKLGNIGVSGTVYAWVLCNAVPAGTQATTVRLHGEYR